MELTRRRAMIALALGAVLIGLAFLKVQGTANKADSAAREAKGATAAIQAERVRSILSSCQTQNRRNAVAYQFLKSLPPSPGQPQRSPGETERLLRGFTDALVGPHRRCADVVAQTAPSAR